MAQSPKPCSALDIVRGLVFSVVGLALLAGGCYLLFERAEFLKTAQVADGEVTRLRAGGAHPEVAFVTAANEPISYPQNGLIWGYEPGQKVRVYYSADKPSSAVIDDRGALWGFPSILAMMGLIFTLVGVLILAKLRRGPLPEWLQQR